MQLNDTTNLNGIYQDIYFNGKITANTFPANDLLRIVNKYYMIAQSDIRAINEDFFGSFHFQQLQTNSGLTFPNQYSLPTLYEKIKGIYASYSPQNTASPVWPTEYVPFTLINQDQLSDLQYNFDASNPYAVIYGNYFLIEPLPTQNVTNGILIFSIDLQTALANATDMPNIFADYQDVITWGSLIDIAIRKGDQVLWKQATAMFAQRRKEMKEYASGRVPDLGTAIVEGQDDTGGWFYPFGQNPMS